MDNHYEAHADEYAMDSKRVADAYADAKDANVVFSLAHGHHVYPSVAISIMTKMFDHIYNTNKSVRERFDRMAKCNIDDRDNDVIIRKECEEIERVFREERK